MKCQRRFRVWFKDHSYTIVTLDELGVWETQQDYDRTEEIPQ